MENLKISDIRKIILDYAKINLSKGSSEKYDLVIRKLIEVLGDSMIHSIRAKEIEQFKFILSTKIKKESINSYIRHIKAIWNLLERFEIIPSHNLKYVKQFKIPEKEIVSFTEQEMKLILDNIKDDRIKNIISFATETGLRISELLNLKLKNIDFNNELISVSNTSDFTTKSRKNRIIPFNDKIRNLLKLILKENNPLIMDKERFLFVARYQMPFKRNHISRTFRRLLDSLNFDKRYHFHCLRATFIMNLVRKGVNPIFIQKLAGHSTLTVTQRYCFLQISDLRNAINT